VIILYRARRTDARRQDGIEDCSRGSLIARAPLGIIKDGDKLKALRCIRMKLGSLINRAPQADSAEARVELPWPHAVSAIGRRPLSRAHGAPEEQVASLNEHLRHHPETSRRA